MVRPARPIARSAGLDSLACRRLVYAASVRLPAHSKDIAVGLLALALTGSGCRIRSTESRADHGAPSASAASSVDRGSSSTPTASRDGGGPLTEAGPDTALAVVAVAGLGTNPANSATALAAVQATRAAFDAGRSCLDAAVAGVVVMEDDPELNAGTGAALRLDDSVELDAAVMDSEGSFSAVAAISEVKNPVRVARAVLDTPHRILAGQGATRFARALGFESFDLKTAAAIERQRALLSRNQDGDAGPLAPEIVAWQEAGGGGASPLPWSPYLLERSRSPVPVRAAAPAPTPAAPEPAASPSALAPAPSRSAPTPTPSSVPVAGSAGVGSERSRPESSDSGPTGGDTVAVLVRCAPGQFAGAVSSGGPWLSLPGRVGDVPVPGGALFVGPKAAVFVTGAGERILERLFARTIYDRLSSSGSLETTLNWALAEFPTGELAVTILDSSRVSVSPESATAWAALDPSLRSSGGGR